MITFEPAKYSLFGEEEDNPILSAIAGDIKGSAPDPEEAEGSRRKAEDILAQMRVAGDYLAYQMGRKEEATIGAPRWIDREIPKQPFSEEQQQEEVVPEKVVPEEPKDTSLLFLEDQRQPSVFTEPKPIDQQAFDTPELPRQEYNLYDHDESGTPDHIGETVLAKSVGATVLRGAAFIGALPEYLTVGGNIMLSNQPRTDGYWEMDPVTGQRRTWVNASLANNPEWGRYLQNLESSNQKIKEAPVFQWLDKYITDPSLAKATDLTNEVIGPHYKSIIDRWNSGDWEGAGEDIGKTLLLEAPNFALIVGLSVLHPGLGAAYAGVSTASVRYAEGQNAGETTTEAFIKGTGHGLAEWAFERLGTERLVGGLRNQAKAGFSRGLIRSMAASAGTEISTEVPTTIVQNVLDGRPWYTGLPETVIVAGTFGAGLTGGFTVNQYASMRKDGMKHAQAVKVMNTENPEAAAKLYTIYRSGNILADINRYNDMLVQTGKAPLTTAERMTMFATRLDKSRGEFLGLASESPDVKTLAEKLLASKEIDAPQKAMIRTMLEKFGDRNPALVIATGEEAGGDKLKKSTMIYRPENNTVYINPALAAGNEGTGNDLAVTLSHEMGHVLTASAIRKVGIEAKTPHEQYTAMIDAALEAGTIDQNEHALLTKLVSMFNKANEILPSDEYAVTNLHEFAAEILTNVKLQRKLGGGVVGELVGAFKEFFGGSSNPLVDAMIETVYDLSEAENAREAADLAVPQEVADAANNGNTDAQYLRHLENVANMSYDEVFEMVKGTVADEAMAKEITASLIKQAIDVKNDLPALPQRFPKEISDVVNMLISNGEHRVYTSGTDEFNFQYVKGYLKPDAVLAMPEAYINQLVSKTTLTPTSKQNLIRDLVDWRNRVYATHYSKDIDPEIIASALRQAYQDDRTVVRFTKEGRAVHKDEIEAQTDFFKDLSAKPIADDRKRNIEKRLLALRPNLDAAEVIKALENDYDTVEQQRAVVHWMTTSGSNLNPLEDRAIIREALKIVNNKKVNPEMYQSPQELVEAFPNKKKTDWVAVESLTKDFFPDDTISHGKDEYKTFWFDDEQNREALGMPALPKGEASFIERYVNIIPPKEVGKHSKPVLFKMWTEAAREYIAEMNSEEITFETITQIPGWTVEIPNQLKLRKIVDSHWGTTVSPLCTIQVATDKNGNPIGTSVWSKGMFAFYGVTGFATRNGKLHMVYGQLKDGYTSRANRAYEGSLFAEEELAPGVTVEYHASTHDNTGDDATEIDKVVFSTKTKDGGRIEIEYESINVVTVGDIKRVMAPDYGAGDDINELLLSTGAKLRRATTYNKNNRKVKVTRDWRGTRGNGMYSAGEYFSPALQEDGTIVLDAPENADNGLREMESVEITDGEYSGGVVKLTFWSEDDTTRTDTRIEAGVHPLVKPYSNGGRVVPETDTIDRLYDVIKATPDTINRLESIPVVYTITAETDDKFDPVRITPDTTKIHFLAKATSMPRVENMLAPESAKTTFAQVHNEDAGAPDGDKHNIQFKWTVPGTQEPILDIRETAVYDGSPLLHYWLDRMSVQILAGASGMETVLSTLHASGGTMWHMVNATRLALGADVITGDTWIPAGIHYVVNYENDTLDGALKKFKNKVNRGDYIDLVNNQPLGFASPGHGFSGEIRSIGIYADIDKKLRPAVPGIEPGDGFIKLASGRVATRSVKIAEYVPATDIFNVTKETAGKLSFIDEAAVARSVKLAQFKDANDLASKPVRNTVGTVDTILAKDLMSPEELIGKAVINRSSYTDQNGLDGKPVIPFQGTVKNVRNDAGDWLLLVEESGGYTRWRPATAFILGDLDTTWEKDLASKPRVPYIDNRIYAAADFIRSADIVTTFRERSLVRSELDKIIEQAEATNTKLDATTLPAILDNGIGGKKITANAKQVLLASVLAENRLDFLRELNSMRLSAGKGAIFSSDILNSRVQENFDYIAKIIAGSKEIKNRHEKARMIESMRLAMLEFAKSGYTKDPATFLRGKENYVKGIGKTGIQNMMVALYAVDGETALREMNHIRISEGKLALSIPASKVSEETKTRILNIMPNSVKKNNERGLLASDFLGFATPSLDALNNPSLDEIQAALTYDMMMAHGRVSRPSAQGVSMIADMRRYFEDVSIRTKSPVLFGLFNGFMNDVNMSHGAVDRRMLNIYQEAEVNPIVGFYVQSNPAISDALKAYLYYGENDQTVYEINGKRRKGATLHKEAKRTIEKIGKRNEGTISPKTDEFFRLADAVKKELAGATLMNQKIRAVADFGRTIEGRVEVNGRSTTRAKAYLDGHKQTVEEVNKWLPSYFSETDGVQQESFEEMSKLWADMKVLGQDAMYGVLEQKKWGRENYFMSDPGTQQERQELFPMDRSRSTTPMGRGGKMHRRTSHVGPVKEINFITAVDRHVRRAEIGARAWRNALGMASEVTRLGLDREAVDIESWMKRQLGTYQFSHWESQAAKAVGAMQGVFWVPYLLDNALKYSLRNISLQSVQGLALLSPEVGTQSFVKMIAGLKDKNSDLRNWLSEEFMMSELSRKRVVEEGMLQQDAFQARAGRIATEKGGDGGRSIKYGLDIGLRGLSYAASSVNFLSDSFNRIMTGALFYQTAHDSAEMALKTGNVKRAWNRVNAETMRPGERQYLFNLFVDGVNSGEIAGFKKFMSEYARLRDLDINFEYRVSGKSMAEQRVETRAGLGVFTYQKGNIQQVVTSALEQLADVSESEKQRIASLPWTEDTVGSIKELINLNDAVLKKDIRMTHKAMQALIMSLMMRVGQGEILRRILGRRKHRLFGMEIDTGEYGMFVFGGGFGLPTISKMGNVGAATGNLLLKAALNPESVTKKDWTRIMKEAGTLLPFVVSTLRTLGRGKEISDEVVAADNIDYLIDGWSYDGDLEPAHRDTIEKIRFFVFGGEPVSDDAIDQREVLEAFFRGFVGASVSKEE